jgi:hypothetical protein
MADRPIIFSGPMVRAILDGRKTQTRRVLKPQPDTDGGEHWVQYPKGWVLAVNGNDEWRRRLLYAPGDRLWVREAFARDSMIANGVRYAATDAIHELRVKRPSIHMPRWASRLTLIVTDVRVQRLHEISEDDARAEGAIPNPTSGIDVGGLYRSAFCTLWCNVHRSEDAWIENPWVAAITFTVRHCNIDALLAKTEGTT